ncbi:HEPN domain-containing protein [Aquimarina megaterium]|uniref:HEPN domain-containing protein n=1 Tax=Aquimarina megaterium TaxID=1443666 RepID=UPI000943DA1E|nr:HEPN domain-containing protein [Aquimarina megaterium]
MELRLTRSEVNEFARNNITAMGMRHIASEDYLGCRCCFFNGLLSPGFVLAEQAIEKELKSILLLLNPSENVRKLGNHKIVPLLQKIENIKKLGLTKFEPLGNRLSNIYELSRYPDNKLNKEINHWTISGIEIVEIDEFFFFLNEVSPLPDELKIRSGIYAYLSPKKKHTLNDWATMENKAYMARKESFEKRYEEFEEYLKKVY